MDLTEVLKAIETAKAAIRASSEYVPNGSDADILGASALRKLQEAEDLINSL